MFALRRRLAGKLFHPLDASRRIAPYLRSCEPKRIYLYHVAYKALFRADQSRRACASKRIQNSAVFRNLM